MNELRNIAIIAHVDHGKTTLVDQLMRQCHVFRENQVVQERFLDSNDLERERGITIISKNISLRYKNVKINLVDTPGHADFGGEVERVLNMADGVLLLVDAFEGPMPQTRFVLEKALHLHLKPVVVINKVDREDGRPDEVLNEIFDLFVELEADDDQLDFPVVYSSARTGWAVLDLEEPRQNMIPLLDAILKHIPVPRTLKGPLQLQVTSIDYNDYVGRIGIGRVHRGTIHESDPLVIIKRNGSQNRIVVKQLFTFEGVGRKPATSVSSGDICAVVGVEGIDIGDTLADPENPVPLSIIAIDEPTISMRFMVNNSPFYGKEGKYVTSRQLRQRLYRAVESDVALQVEDTKTPDAYKVYGRGILHLSILIENMRREGYEIQIGQPKVIYKTIDGKKAEPIEILVVDVPSEFAGKVIEEVGKKRGEMVRMEPKGTVHHLEFHIPSRGLIGLRNRLLTLTSGEAVMHHRFYQYEFFKGAIAQRQNGVIISMAEGNSTAYAINSLQDRGIFFIKPGQKVYRGQIIGENAKEMDIQVNIQRGKKLTNMRAAGSDKAIKITPATVFSLEEALEFINDDELVEITPESIRLRKLYLDENDRKRVKLHKEFVSN